MYVISVYITGRPSLRPFLLVIDFAGHVLSRHSRLDPKSKKSIFCSASQGAPAQGSGLTGGIKAALVISLGWQVLIYVIRGSEQRESSYASEKKNYLLILKCAVCAFQTTTIKAECPQRHATLPGFEFRVLLKI